MLTILVALLALWHHFWAPLGHLGVTFEEFWMHFLCQKTDWGAKGAQRGATPVRSHPFGHLLESITVVKSHVFYTS